MSYQNFVEQGAVRAVTVAISAVLSVLVMTSESIAVIHGSLVLLTGVLLAAHAPQLMTRKR